MKFIQRDNKVWVHSLLTKSGSIQCPRYYKQTSFLFRTLPKAKNILPIVYR